MYDVEAIATEVDSDWAEDMVVEEEDSGGEDSVSLIPIILKFIRLM